MSPLLKGIFKENLTLSEVEVSSLTGDCILRLRSGSIDCTGSVGFEQDPSASLRIQLIGLFVVGRIIMVTDLPQRRQLKVQ